MAAIRIRDVGAPHGESRNPRRVGAYTNRRRTRVLLPRFDPGRSQNDYNNYFIRRGSGPLCLPILKVITRCLHCPSGTALRGSLLPAPRYTVTRCTMNLHFMYTRLRVPCARLLFSVTLPSRTMRLCVLQLTTCEYRCEARGIFHSFLYFRCFRSLSAN